MLLDCHIRYYKEELLDITKNLCSTQVDDCERVILQKLLVSTEKMVVALDNDCFDEKCLENTLKTLKNTFDKLDLEEDIEGILDSILSILSGLVHEIISSYDYHEDISTIWCTTGFNLQRKFWDVCDIVRSSRALSEGFREVLGDILGIYLDIVECITGNDPYEE